jgi:PAS domain S-box-containing protein
MNAASTARRRIHWKPYLGLGASLAVTGIAAWYIHSAVRKQADTELNDHERFVTAMNRVTEALHDRLQEYDAGLREVVIRHTGEHAKADTSQLRERFRFTTPGTLSESGEDVATAAAIRSVFTRARATGSGNRLVPALGPHLGGAEQAFLLYIPVYPDQPVSADTSDPVRPIGLGYTTLHVAAFAAGALDSVSRSKLHIRLFRAHDTDAADLIYDSGSPGVNLPWRSQLRVGTAFDMMGTPWTLKFDPLPAFGASKDVDPVPTVLVAGALIALAIFYRLRTHSRAPTSADESRRERQLGVTAMPESDERFRQVANHLEEALFVAELPTWRPLYVSAAWAEIWGRPISEAADPESWLESIHPDDRVAVADGRDAIRRGEGVVNVFRVMRPDGTLRWVRERTFPVRDEHADVYRAVGVSEDITELRLSESRIQQEQKLEAMGRLAGGIAHDFNNLLTIIVGEAEELLAAGTPGAVSSATAIRTAGERAAALTGQLLAFSARQTAAPMVFDLNASVAALGTVLYRLIGEDIDLVMRLAPDTWQPRADPAHVEQVLVNLVVNARDAMPMGGTLTVETGNVTLDGEYAWENAAVQAGDYVVLTVSDTGTGMTADVRARLFEPFFTTKERGQGAGLGLATCYGIVRQAGGHIAVYSEPALGTTVKVYLPQGSESVVRSTATARLELPRGNETILLVEDDAAVRGIAARLLQGQGYTVLEAESGTVAAQLIGSHCGNIDLLLTDVVLQGIGGREIANQARAKRPGISVLFTSGYTDDVILQHRLLERDVALLSKPFSRESIACKVREVLDAPVELEVHV